MKYDNFRYIYPPRPKNAINPNEIDSWDNGSLVGQVKMNGSNATIYTNGEKYFIMNRHGQRLTGVQLTKEEINDLYRGDGRWMVINGEYMNKQKKDENNLPFNHKFVVFDILVYNGEYLVGKSFEDRVKLIDELYGQVESNKEYLYKISDNIFRVKSYYDLFSQLFEKYTKIDMIEGLVFKRRNAKLEMGNTEENNTRSQIKARKPTKNYKY